MLNGCCVFGMDDASMKDFLITPTIVLSFRMDILKKDKKKLSIKRDLSYKHTSTRRKPFKSISYTYIMHEHTNSLYKKRLVPKIATRNYPNF